MLPGNRLSSLCYISFGFWSVWTKFLSRYIQTPFLSYTFDFLIAVSFTRTISSSRGGTFNMMSRLSPQDDLDIGCPEGLVVRCQDLKIINILTHPILRYIGIGCQDLVIGWSDPGTIESFRISSRYLGIKIFFFKCQAKYTGLGRLKYSTCSTQIQDLVRSNTHTFVNDTCFFKSKKKNKAYTPG